MSVPASKSLTNRFLLLAGLGRGPATVINPLRSRDSDLMLAGLEVLGASVERMPDTEGEETLRVSPIVWDAPDDGSPAEIDCGLAGTVMRFLPAVAALTGRAVRFDGDPEARVRPMGAVLDGLRALGAEIEEHGEPGFLPFTVHPPAGGVVGGEVTIDASASSQFVSGLLLAAPLFREGLTLRHSGAQVPSLEHVEMTMAVLQEVGARASSPAPFAWRVEPGEITGFTVRVEPDLSNAGPFLCAAALTAGEVSMEGWPLESTQIGRRWPRLLEDFGCETTLAPTSESTGTLTVRGPERLVSPGTVDGTAELTPTVAALAAAADGETTFTSVQHLRGHETDRLAALVAEIRRLGGSAEETEDGFRVTAPAQHGTVVCAYADHRMATFGAMMGLVLDGVEVDDIGTTAKTMPDFPARWAALVS
ncbi:3-phosphoshikimate 1-carboxyvinyltransferase [Nesterenkonia sp. NBAIMH1]|uniref:3-phosphoshikimate 1-carboxyvinyltransferase n=1 Tax=Nesterenkonia sp. NBAIMH1 TaxID=2600320 RepID=UPI001FEF3826